MSKDAIRNYEVGPDAAKTYGKVTSIMMFDTADGYTIYSDVAFALSNCDEDSELTVNSNAEIEGYNFAQWIQYNLGARYVGETNAYADFKAITVFVTVKFVNGITYYCNGIEFAIYDSPVKVEYDSVFTAKISDTSKYQGTPLVNGKNSLIITEDTEIVGSGVEPIPVPPEPEPEPVIGDSGISLTDILLIVLVILIAIMVVILVLRINRS